MKDFLQATAGVATLISILGLVFITTIPVAVVA